MHPAEQIAVIIKRIYRSGMTTTSGGNLSIRDDNGDIWITPSAIDKGTLKPSDMIRVTKSGEIIGPHTPLLPMYTLGHDFKPANIHAGGLRYHGAGMIVSQLIKDKMMHGVDIPQLESFEAGMLFARTEGIIPAPESCHAIAATIREAKKCKESGETKVILFNLSGHGLIDMTAYDSYLNGDLRNYQVTDSEIRKNLEDVPKVDMSKL